MESSVTDQTGKEVFLAHLLQLGFAMENPDDYNDSLLAEWDSLIEALVELRGGGLAHIPLFSEFPDLVPDLDEYHLDRLLGYVISCSKWDIPGERLETGVVVPDWLFDLKRFGADPVTQTQDWGLFLRETFRQQARKVETPSKATLLKFVSKEKLVEVLEGWVTWCLTSKTSIPASHREEVQAVLGALEGLTFRPEQLTFREHRAVYGAHLWRTGDDARLLELCTYPLDVLRLLVALSGGDISLTEKVSFPKLNRSQRRRVLGLLENTAPDEVSDDEFVRYRGLWLALERSLHSGEFGKRFPRTHGRFRALQEGRLRPRLSALEQSFRDKSVSEVLRELERLPSGVTLRRFGQTLALSPSLKTLDTLLSTVERAPLKDLLTLHGILRRDAWAERALVLTKRGCTRAIPRNPGRFPGEIRERAVEGVARNLSRRIRDFYGSNSWKDRTVFVEEALTNYTLATSLRSSSETLVTLGRGSSLALGSLNTLRLFVYWKQSTRRTDLDLSVLTFDEQMKVTSQVSWTNLKSTGLSHSGDLQSAPHGAAEFIDADLETLTKAGHRYLGMFVYRYSGDYFQNMACYCGWMMREYPDATYRTFDIATVEQKMNLSGEVRCALPAVFDLRERRALWLDLRFYGTQSHNQLEKNWQRLEEALSLAVLEPLWRPNLHQLALWHARERGATQVNSPEAADIVFAVDPSADYHPGNWPKILSELL